MYNACLVDGSLSTELLFPVLMSSNLPKNLLGELWQHANRKVPGQLTKTELFVLLGLIGLAQVSGIEVVSLSRNLLCDFVYAI